MVQVAGFRGALLNPTKVDVASVAMAPLTGVKTRLAKGELVRDARPAVYRYHQTFTHQGRTVTRKTFLAAVHLEPWSAGVIRPHEETSPMARELAADGIGNEAAHTDAVFCGYRDAEHAVEKLFETCEQELPLVQVTTADRTVHTLWRESHANVIAALRDQLAQAALHVLDGNGRYEGMLAYRDRVGGDALPARSTASFALACLVNVEDPALELVPRHRVVRGPTWSRIDVLSAAKAFFSVDRVPGAADNVPKQQAALAELGDKQGFLALFPDDPDAWKLTLLPTTGVRGEQKIDPVVVEDVFLKRVVPAGKARSVLEPATVVRAVDDGAIGLILRPITLAHVLRADESGKLLPFGSTAIRPNLARLVTYLIDPQDTLA